MDIGDSDSKEQLLNGRGQYHSEIFQVVDFDPVAHLTSIIPVFWQAWLMIHGQDKSNRTTITLNGNNWEVSEAEALIHWYLVTEHSRIKLAIDDKEIVGLLVYNRVFEGVFAIRLFYVLPHKMRTKTGHKLISSLEDVHTLLFQTKNDLPPEAMFEITRGREKKLHQSDIVTTWTMPWEKK